MDQKKLKLKPIDQQVIVITGASSGIGLATARYAARLGAKVVLGARNLTALKKVVLDIKKEGGEAIAVKVDVTKLDQVENLRDEALKAFARIDTWINNAGKSIFGHLVEVPLEEEREIFETNFWGTRHGCRVALPVLAKNGGALINVGSEVSEVAIPLQGIYSASKHAVKAYTDALRSELEINDVPVSVTLVRPAAINTPYLQHAKNRLPAGKAPSLPSPVYDVDLVANAILKCAETPMRDAYIGLASRAFHLLETFAPRLTDFIVKKTTYSQQMEGNPADHPKHQESVGQVPKTEGKMRGKVDKPVAKSSLYTKLNVGQKKAPRKKTAA